MSRAKAWISKAYWKFVDWISARVFFLAVAPWVGPVFGGLLVSSNLVRGGSGLLIGVGVMLIFISTIPLGLQAIRRHRLERNEDRLDAQERTCLDLVAELLPSIPTGGDVSRRVRCTRRDDATKQVVEALVSKVYPNIPRVRAVVFALGVTADGAEALSPVAHAGRGSEPDTYVAGTERFDELMGLIQGVSETRIERGVEGRSYRSYVSSSLAKGEEAFGMLTVDTPADWEFSERDRHNLLLLSQLLVAFYMAAERGKRA